MGSSAILGDDLLHHHHPLPLPLTNSTSTIASASASAAPAPAEAEAEARQPLHRAHLLHIANSHASLSLAPPFLTPHGR